MKFNKRFWSEGPGSFAIAIGIALFIRWALLEAYVIPSGSMLPTLLINDHIFVNKLVYGLRVPFTENWLFEFKDVERGEVIVFRYPKNPSLFYVKRVVGLPGDRVTYEDGDLYINDELVEKKPPTTTKSEFKWLRKEDFSGRDPSVHYTHWQENLGEHSHSVLLSKGEHFREYGPYTVPEDHYFVMGDNRDHSQDSRAWDADKRFVPRDLLIGRASFVWLSCEEKLPVVSFLCNPLTVRFKRFFHFID